jgi:MscS family membrane protein
VEYKRLTKIGDILKTRTKINEMIIRTVKNPVGYFILLEGFYLAILALELPENIFGIKPISVLIGINLILSSLIILYFIFRLIDIIGYYLGEHATSRTFDQQLVTLLIRSLKVIVVLIGILAIIQNFGYNILSVLAGLGLGGLALALAAQTTLTNIFGSIAIFADKPFRLGDWISIGDIEGTVEDVGFRSTRIRRFDQALVVVPNSLFVSKEVINYSKMIKRRIKFDLRLEYGTKVNQIKDVVAGIKKIIEEDNRFDHSYYIVRFREFGENSLDIYIHCFTKATKLDEFLEVREEFNLKILQLLEDLNVEIAKESAG